jgi:hypothetical protein
MHARRREKAIFSFLCPDEKGCATKFQKMRAKISMTNQVNFKNPLQKALRFVFEKPERETRKILLTNFVAFACTL